MKEYRIVQAADDSFYVEGRSIEKQKKTGWLWWRAVCAPTWNRTALKYFGGGAYPQSFKTEVLPQKWIDDKRKYPIVVKEPA